MNCLVLLVFCLFGVWNFDLSMLASISGHCLYGFNVILLIGSTCW